MCKKLLDSGLNLQLVELLYAESYGHEESVLFPWYSQSWSMLRWFVILFRLPCWMSSSMFKDWVKKKCLLGLVSVWHIRMFLLWSWQMTLASSHLEGICSAPFSSISWKNGIDFTVLLRQDQGVIFETLSEGQVSPQLHSWSYSAIGQQDTPLCQLSWPLCPNFWEEGQAAGWCSFIDALFVCFVNLFSFDSHYLYFVVLNMVFTVTLLSL